MLSGIGPADELRASDVVVVHDLPGVGRNLQDHLELYVQYACNEPITLMTAMRPHNMARIGASWFIGKKGLGASSHLEAGAFIRSAAGIPHPDIQYHFLPALIDDHGRSPATFHAFQAHVGPMRPASRGRLRLRSSEPGQHPLIEPNLLAEARDREEMRACVRLSREIFAQPAFDAFRGREIRPGPDVHSDAEIDAFVRQKADSAYHPCGTCRMGTDASAVVDAQCRVHGIEGLRVVDASIMPDEPSGNLNAPTIMLAEKASDLIRGRPPLPASDAPVWQAPAWRSRQRTGEPVRPVAS
jgi:choline dehydrogenase